MVSQQLNHPVQLELVQRKLRGQRPQNVVEVAEKLGFLLRRLQVSWSDLRQLLFRLYCCGILLSNWVVVYGMKGNALIIANPLNADGTCELFTPISVCRILGWEIMAS